MGDGHGMVGLSFAQKKIILVARITKIVKQNLSWLGIDLDRKVVHLSFPAKLYITPSCIPSRLKSLLKLKYIYLS